MSMYAKYVIIDAHIGGEFAIIGPNFVQHTDLLMYHGIERCKGAGFVAFGPDGSQCHGESVTLGIKSRGEVDSQIVNRMLKL